MLVTFTNQAARMLRASKFIGSLVKHPNMTCRTIHSSAVLPVYWNKDWKPGRYPETKEERLAAARKYGMIPEDYEPYPDDGTGRGDYPMLPMVSEEARDPNDYWDFPEFRRNFGEVAHVKWEYMTADKWNPNIHETSKHGGWYWFFVLTGSFALMGFVLFSTPNILAGPPILPKQYPFSHGTSDVHRCYHYSFDLEDAAES